MLTTQNIDGITARGTSLARVEVVTGSPEETEALAARLAAALYTRSMLGVLEEDFRRIPELLGPAVVAAVPQTPSVLEPEPEPDREHLYEPAVQLGLF